MLPYQKANLPINERVEDLLARMTLEEKVGQLVLLNGAKHDFVSEMKEQDAGGILQLLGEDCRKAILAQGNPV